MKFQPKRKIDKAAVERSLRELELLFGRKEQSTKENTQRQLGVSTTGNVNREVQHDG